MVYVEQWRSLVHTTASASSTWWSKVQSLLLSLAVVLLGVVPSASAGVPETYGLGARSSAMAGAVSADVHDFSASHYNPAGLVSADTISLSVGYAYHHQSLQLNGLDSGVEDVRGVSAGVVAPAQLWGVPFAFGVALYLPDDGLSFIKARRQGVPRWELYDTRSQLLHLSAALAIKPLPWLQLGAGVGYLSATRGSFGIRGRADVIHPFNSQLQHQVDADLTAVRYPQLGIRLWWQGWGALALNYRGESQIDLALDAHLNGVVDFAGIDVPLLYDLEARTLSAFTPRQVTVGLTFVRVKKMSINVDVSWVNWRAYRSPTAAVVAALSIEPPAGIDIAVPPSPTPTVPIAPNFANRVVPRIGVEYRGACFGGMRHVHGQDKPLAMVPLRAGYVYEHSPVPAQRGITNLIDAHRHTFSLGSGITLHRPIRELPGSVAVDVHANFSYLPERITLKDSPADTVGDYRAAGSMFGGGFTLSTSF